jgi:hypothetical protein
MPWIIHTPVEVMTLLGFSSPCGISPAPGGKRTTVSGPARYLREAAPSWALRPYAFAPEFLPRGSAFAVVAICYVLDQCDGAITMTRAVYAKSIMKSPQDLDATLSLNISLDHAVTMFLPALGGLVWRTGGDLGYRYVFLGGACRGGPQLHRHAGIKTTEAAHR